jgi:hypothetical protein
MNQIKREDLTVASYGTFGKQFVDLQFCESMSIKLTERNVSRDVQRGYLQTPRLLVASIKTSYADNIQKVHCEVSDGVFNFRDSACRLAD